MPACNATPGKFVESLTDLELLSWRGGALIGVERVARQLARGPRRARRSGVRAQPRHVLAASPDATVGALGANAYYYVAAPGVLRRLPLGNSVPR